MKKILASLVCLLIVLYFAVVYILGYVVQDRLEHAQEYVSAASDPVIRQTRISYVATSSGLFTRDGILVVEHPLTGQSRIPTVIKSGFINLNVAMDASSLLNSLKGKLDYIPSILKNGAITGSLVADVNVLAFKATADVSVHAPYANAKNPDLDIKLSAVLDSSKKPAAYLTVANYLNPKLLSVKDFSYKGYIEGVPEITSIGEGTATARSLKVKRENFETLNVDYKTHSYDDKKNFEVDFTVKGNGVLEYLKTFDIKGSAASLNLMKILDYEKFRSKERQSFDSVVLADLKKVTLSKADFSLSDKFARRLLSKGSAALNFRSNGEFTLSYPDIEHTLSGVLHLKTNALEGLAYLMKANSSGEFETDLVIRNGEYQLGEFKFDEDFLKSALKSGLFKKLKLDSKIEKHTKKLDKELKKLEEKIGADPVKLFNNFLR